MCVIRSSTERINNFQNLQTSHERESHTRSSISPSGWSPKRSPRQRIRLIKHFINWRAGVLLSLSAWLLGTNPCKDPAPYRLVPGPSSPRRTGPQYDNFQAVRWIMVAREICRQLVESHIASAVCNSTNNYKPYTYIIFCGTSYSALFFFFRERTDKRAAVCSSVTAHRRWVTVRTSDRLWPVCPFSNGVLNKISVV